VPSVEVSPVVLLVNFNLGTVELYIATPVPFGKLGELVPIPTF